MLGNYSCGPRPLVHGFGNETPGVDDAFFVRALAEGHYTNVALAFSGTFLLTNFPQERLLVGDSFEFQRAWWARLSGLVRLSFTNFDRMAGVARISSTKFPVWIMGKLSNSPRKKRPLLPPLPSNLRPRRGEPRLPRAQILSGFGGPGRCRRPISDGAVLSRW